MKSTGKTIRLFEGSAAVHEDKSQYSRTHAQPVNLAHDKSKHRPINALTHSCHEQKRLSREIPSVATPRKHRIRSLFVITRPVIRPIFPFLFFHFIVETKVARLRVYIYIGFARATTLEHVKNGRRLVSIRYK